VQLSQSVPMTYKFRLEMNQYLSEFFGVEYFATGDIVIDGKVFHVDSRVDVSPENLHILMQT